MTRRVLAAALARLLLAATLCSTVAAAAQASNFGNVFMRSGDHAGFGRLVFDLPEEATYKMTREGGRLLFAFENAGTVRRPNYLPRNFASVQTGLNAATLQLAPGAQPRSSQMGRMLIIDAFDPPAPSKARNDLAAPADATAEASPAAQALQPGPQAAAPAPSEAEPSRRDAEVLALQAAALAPPEPTPGSPAPAQPRKPLATTPPSPRAPVLPVAQQPLPPLAKAPPALPKPEPPQPILLRTDADVGAAAFRRGDFGYVVLDRRLRLPDPPDGTQWLPGAVSIALQVPLPPASALRLARKPDGWLVERVSKAPRPAGIEPVAGSGETALPLPRPGRVVAMLDPMTGGTLLVGASLADGDASATPLLRRTPDYAMLPTWLGVVIEPLADRVDLRSVPGGFTLVGNALPQASAQVRQTRRFDFPNEPEAVLTNRLNAQIASAAAAPPRARTASRVAAAQTMIALGMGVEAEAVADLIAAEDPQAAADAEIVGLKAVAAVMAGRYQDAGGLDDPRLDGTDEIALWRGVRDRALDKDTPTTRRLAELGPLASAYPPGLRRLVWPVVAEAAISAGAPVPDGPLSDFASGLQLERAGKVDDAIAAYKKSAAGRDRLDQVRAAARMAELRLAAGQIGPADAAKALERVAYSWRGDEREARLRLRAAELRGAAGDWRAALSALKGIGEEFPDQPAAVKQAKTAVLEKMLAAQGEGLSPLELVLLAADYADGVPEGAQGAALARLLADKLMALDLPARAIPVLQGLMKGAPAGEPRAEFGVRLAQLLIDGGDPASAAAALDASSAPGLPAPVQQARSIVEARIAAAQGDLPGAVATLRSLDDATADDVRATLLVNAHDWPGALEALASLAAKRIPATGPLTEADQDLLLRQASAAAQASDQAALLRLAQSTPRLTGQRADLFRLLTAPPIATEADLPRAARELALARGIPQQIGAVGK